MTSTTRRPDLTRAQLIQIVRTGQPIEGIGKMRALAALQGREFRDMTDVLVETLADKQEAPRFRHLAVLALYKQGGARADEALVAASRTADDLTAPTIAMALGRIGPPKRMATIEKLQGVAARHAKPHVAFAATLLAYRHRLQGHDVRAPAATTFQELGRRRSRPIEIAPAPVDAAKLALAALADEPIAIDLTTDGALQLVCDPNTFVWLWTSDAGGGGFTALTERKGVAGVLFRKRRLEDAYALSGFGLGTPTRGGVRATVHRAESGRILYAGLASADGAVELKATDQPGLAAVEISGRVEAGRVDVTKAKSAAVAREAKTPKQS